MSENKFNQDDVVAMFIPKKAIQDNLLVTASIAMIAGLIFLVGTNNSFSDVVKFSLVTSVISLSASLFLLLWYNPRLEHRSLLMKSMIEKRVEKMKDDIKKFANYYYKPLFLAKLTTNLQELRDKKFKSKVEFQHALHIAMNKAEEDSRPSEENDKFTAGVFYRDFLKDMYFLDERIFHTPLDESYKKFKHFLDIFSFKFRYHCFVIGIVSLVFAIVAHVLA